MWSEAILAAFQIKFIVKLTIYTPLYIRRSCCHGPSRPSSACVHRGVPDSYRLRPISVGTKCRGVALGLRETTGSLSRCVLGHNVFNLIADPCRK
jgi:hypothetical protein